MGIKELWPFLNPYCVRKPMYELQGKTVAIDLAGWICESLCVVDYEVQARFYLRNLFFRTCYLLLSGITPIFVLEGTAPVLKHQMISKRNQIQFRGAKPRKNTPPTQGTQTSQANTQTASKGRTRFNYVLKQCEELIRSMGLHCVQGPGEAEAFCSHLNARGLVDGVVSQDSDCFAYGARRVFRNFSLSMQGTAGSIGGSIDIYDLDFVQQSIDFGRNKIVVMALLCGCDYCPEGVGGVGRDAVQKLFGIYSDNDILDRIRLWRKNDNKFTELEIKVDDKKLCVNCGHHGRVQSHTKSGCAQCKMNRGCDSSIWKDKRLALKSELQIRKKAMQTTDFPSEEIIQEFMQEPIDMSSLQLDWCQPNVIKFLKMMGKLIQWDEIYCFQKFLPLLTRWQLHHMNSNPDSDMALRGSVQPDFIKKKRTPRGVPSFEIIWKDEQGCFVSLIPDDQLQTFYSTNKEKSETEAMQLLWSTIEPIDLVQKAYPELIHKFEESKTNGKSKKTKKPKDPSQSAKSHSAKNSKAMESENSTGKATKKLPSRAGAKSNKKNDENVQPIELFFRKQQIHSAAVYSSPKIKTSTKPMNLSAFSIDFNNSHMLLDNDDMNLSAIINEMVSRPPNITEFNGKKLKFDQITTKENARPIESDDKDSFDPFRGLETEMTSKATEQSKHEEKPMMADDSIDEFDLIVMRRGRKSLIERRKQRMEFDFGESKLNNCSTPVSRNHRDLSMNGSLKQRSTLDLSPAIEITKNRKNMVISSSFFTVNPEDEIDLFEKSVDFRNMQDVDSEEESDQNQSPLDSSAKCQNDEDFNQYDTFDRLVGIA